MLKEMSFDEMLQVNGGGSAAGVAVLLFTGAVMMVVAAPIVAAVAPTVAVAAFVSVWTAGASIAVSAASDM